MKNEQESIEQKLRTGEDVEPPADLLRKIHAEIPADLGARTNIRRMVWLPIAASICAAVLAGVIVWRTDLTGSKVLSTAEAPAQVEAAGPDTPMTGADAVRIESVVDAAPPVAGAGESVRSQTAAHPDVTSKGVVPSPRQTAPPAAPPAVAKETAAEAPREVRVMEPADQAEAITVAQPAGAVAERTERGERLEVAMSKPAAPPPAAIAAANADVASNEGSSRDATAGPSASRRELFLDRRAHDASAKGQTAAAPLDFETIRTMLARGKLPPAAAVDAERIADWTITAEAGEVWVISTRTPFLPPDAALLLVARDRGTEPMRVELTFAGFSDATSIRKISSGRNIRKDAIDLGRNRLTAAYEISRFLSDRETIDIRSFVPERHSTHESQSNGGSVASWRDLRKEARVSVIALRFGELLASSSRSAVAWNQLLEEARRAGDSAKSRDLRQAIDRAAELALSGVAD